MTKKFQNKYRVQTARAVWHDYNGGVYFVTICTKNREHYFGKIVGNENDEPQMELSEIGHFVADNLQNVSQHYPYAEIPLYVVMPNHIHAIVIIDGEKTPYERRNCKNAAQPVETRCTTSLQTRCATSLQTRCATSLQTRCATPLQTRCATPLQTRCDTPLQTKRMTDIANMQGWLSVVIGGLKRAITNFAHQNNIDFAWQTRFHDRIVRDQNELNRIAEYIENNVANWHDDELNDG